MNSNSDMMAAMFACVQDGRYNLDHVVGFIYDGIYTTVREAEAETNTGNNAAAIIKLRELQAHAEHLIGLLGANSPKRLRLVEG